MSQRQEEDVDAEPAIELHDAEAAAQVCLIGSHIQSLHFFCIQVSQGQGAEDEMEGMEMTFFYSG